MIENAETISKKIMTDKQLFAGISLGATATAESGIAMIDKNLNLLRVEKAFNLNEIQAYLKAMGSVDKLVLCIDLPRNTNINPNKWRADAINTKPLRLNSLDCSKLSWTERYSDRGMDLCNSFISLGAEIYRYNCYFAQNTLRIDSPYKSRTPAACKHLQMSIKNILKISGLPSNLIALAGLEAIVGAYTAWKIWSSEENIGYKQIGVFRNIPIINPA